MAVLSLLFPASAVHEALTPKFNIGLTRGQIIWLKYLVNLVLGSAVVYLLNQHSQNIPKEQIETNGKLKYPAYLNYMTPFEQIWTQVPEIQNPTSTSWWFFLLLPEGEEGYGPEQMMFTYASRTGKMYGVNNQWQKGMNLHREVTLEKDEFMTTIAGWVFDGENVYDNVVLEPVKATLVKGKIDAWNHYNGTKYGASIHAGDPEIEEMQVHFEGEKGYAKFRVWSTSDNPLEKLRVTDNRFKVAGAHVVANRSYRFEGEFKSPSGTSTKTGMCYFQRVCSNMPLLPWFWNYTVFQDGSIFSGFQPYIGAQFLRKRTWFFPGWLERANLPIFKEAYFTDAKTQETTVFKNLRIIPLFDRGEHPWFQITAKNSDEEYFKLLFSARGHTQFLLDHPIINQLRISRFNYNEYMLKVEKMDAKVAGKTVTLEDLGNGFGNMEYTWGYGW